MMNNQQFMHNSLTGQFMQMVQFWLFLLYSKVENDPQACTLIYLISMATFYFNILLLEWAILVKE